MIYEEIGDAMSANNGQVGKEAMSTTLLVGGLTYTGRENVVGSTCWEEVDNIVLNPRWTLAEYCQKCEGMTDVGLFGAMAVNGDNLVMSDQNKFHRDTAQGAWNQRWELLKK